MILVKIGGSVITDKSGFEAPKPKALAAVATVLSAFLKAHPGEQLAVVHGAGSFGHPHVVKYKLQNGAPTPAQRKGVEMTQKAVERLNTHVVAALNRAGLAAKPLLSRSIAISRAGRLERLVLSSIVEMLNAGIVPVLPGDVVPDGEWGFSVLSGDQLVAQLGRQAKRIVVITNTDGILKNGQTVQRIKKTDIDSVLGFVGASESTDVTGGMRGKLLEMLSIGQPVSIISSADPKNLMAALEGKRCRGTVLG